VGYRAYEYIPASTAGRPGRSRIGHVVFKNGQPYKGSPVAAYKILSHFDRQRQYNAATGEQTNILVEGHRRSPLVRARVHARRLAREPAEVLRLQRERQIGTDPTNNRGVYFRYVTDSDQNQQQKQLGRGARCQRRAELLRLHRRSDHGPADDYYPGYGRLPYCLFNATVDCESELIRVRTSVKKVDDAHVMDYEPLTYDDSLMVKFGFFRNTMLSYNQGYGYTESGRILYAMRHDIWQKAHDATAPPFPSSSAR